MNDKASPLVIFQNYYSPYRHKLFNEIGKEIDLTVVYLQTPDEEGRKWETDIEGSKKKYKTIQLQNKRISKIPPFNKVVLAQGIKELANKIPRHAKIVYLDNLPTNITTMRLFFALAKIPRKNRILWNEHILPKGADGLLKDLYKKFFTYYFALQVDTIISFSQMNTEYLQSLRLPLSGQKIVRTIQSTYTETEIETYKKESQRSQPAVLTFGFLGYFSERKGIRQILTAISYYKNPKSQFFFAGDGPLKNDIAKAALRDHRIQLEKYIATEEGKTRFFNEIDFNLVASDKDPWCLVVNEAASRGVPSIVAPAVGAQEMIRLIDKSLVLSSNEAISLAKAFVDAETIASDQEKMKGLRERTHKIAHLWNIEQAASVFIEIATT